MSALFVVFNAYAAHLTGEINNLEQQLEDRINSINNDKQEATLRYQENISNLDRQIANRDARLQTELNKADQQIERLQNNLNIQLSRLDQQESKAVLNHEQRLQRLEGDKEKIEIRFNMLIDKLEQINTTQKNNAQKIFNSEQAQFDRAIAREESSFRNQVDKFNDIYSDRPEILEQKLDQIERDHDATLEELQRRKVLSQQNYDNRIRQADSQLELKIRETEQNHALKLQNIESAIERENQSFEGRLANLEIKRQELTNNFNGKIKNFQDKKAQLSSRNQSDVAELVQRKNTETQQFQQRINRLDEQDADIRADFERKIDELEARQEFEHQESLSPTATFSPTPSASLTPTSTATPTSSSSPSPSVMPSPSLTPSSTPTPAPSPSITPSPTPELNPKPNIKEGTIIIAFGDSLVSGFNISAGDTFPAILSEDIDYDVINKGAEGDTTATALARVRDDVSNLKPDIVIILLGGNDFLSGNFTRIQTFNNLKSIVEILQEENISIILLEVDNGLFPFNVVADYDLLARDTDVLYMPNALSGILGSFSNTVDFVHPNEKGHRIIADRTLPFLLQALADKNLLGQ